MTKREMSIVSKDYATSAAKKFFEHRGLVDPERDHAALEQMELAALLALAHDAGRESGFAEERMPLGDRAMMILERAAKEDPKLHFQRMVDTGLICKHGCVLAYGTEHNPGCPEST